MREQSADFKRFYRRSKVHSSVDTDSLLTGGGWLGVQAEAGVPRAADCLLQQEKAETDSPLMGGEQKTQSVDRAEETSRLTMEFEGIPESFYKNRTSEVIHTVRSHR